MMDCCSCHNLVKPSLTSAKPLLNYYQDVSQVNRRTSVKIKYPGLGGLSPRPFLLLGDQFLPFLPERCPSLLPLRTCRNNISSEAGRKGWDFGRFIKTLYFFNGPPSPAKFVEFLIEKLSNPSPSKIASTMDKSGIILVAGATGGVGRRVVDVLRCKGFRVKVLVRNEEKARKMLGSDVDLTVGDITQSSTLVPDNFKGVRKVINAVSVIVGPKEGDTPDRAKYSQGIIFLEPEVVNSLPGKCL